MAQQQTVQSNVSVYANVGALSAETDLLPLGTNVLVDGVGVFQATQANPAATTFVAPIASTYTNPTTQATTITYWVPTSGPMRITQSFTLAQLQALTSGTAFAIGPVLPTNARLLGAEVQVVTPLAGNTSDVVTMQGGSDAAGTIIASTTVFTGAQPYVAVTGSNPYRTRGGTQIYATLTGGSALSGLTAGALTFNLYVSVTP